MFYLQITNFWEMRKNMFIFVILDVYARGSLRLKLGGRYIKLYNFGLYVPDIFDKIHNLRWKILQICYKKWR